MISKNIAIKISVSLLFILLIIHFVPLKGICESVINIDKRALLSAFLFAVICIFLKSLKWYILIYDQIESKNFWPIAGSFLIGVAFALVTPSRTGELMRAFWVDSDKKAELIGFTVIDKILDLIAVAGLASGALFLLAPAAWGISVAIFVISGLVILYNAKITGDIIIRFLDKFKKIPFRDKIIMFFGSLKALGKNKLTSVLAITFFAFFLWIIQGHILTSAFGHISFKVSFISWPLIILTNVIPITFGGLGPREGASVLLLSNTFGISKASAVGVSLIFFTINTLIPGLFGAMLTFFYKKRMQRAG